MVLTLCLGVCLLQEWTQDAHDAQRTGYTAEEPTLPWTLAWTWNGPDAGGGTGGHVYHQPTPYTPWEARTCTGGAHVYVPGNANGLYALKKSDGTVAWRMSTSAVNVTPAYDPATRTVYAGADTGTLYKLNADTGAVLGSYASGAKIVKSVMLVGGHAYVLTAPGLLHKVSTSSMTAAWTYAAGSAPQTLPAYSASRQAVVFCTADLQVHAVNDGNGSQKWKVKPSTLPAGTYVEFQGGWPVIAEQHGIVFVRMIIGDVNAVLWSGGGTSSKWPTTNAAIRARLQANPGLKNLFALSLDSGAEAFVPAVGPAGVEDLIGGNPRLRVHNFPVVRVVGGKEVAYSQWRHGDTRDAGWDARWDSHLGEMVLDGTTVSGYAAGDLRFVKFEEHDHWIRITDEACPLTMAGETIFHAHWDASEAVRISDRSAGLGGTRANPIQTAKQPSVLRHVAAAGAQYNATTHWSATGMNLVDGRWKAAPGWWVYWNVLDPPTPNRSAYSEGVLPRYTYVSDGLVIVEGNGGDLFVLRHSGTPLPSPGGGGGGATAPSAPTNLAASAAGSTRVDLSWTDTSSNETGFRVERRAGTGPWGEIATASASPWSDSTASPATSYTYRVRATNAAGASAYSNEAAATTPAASSAPPVVSFTSPASGASLVGTVAVNAYAYDPDAGTSDGAGITSLLFELRQGPTVMASHTESTAPYDWSLDTRSFADGSYTLRATAIGGGASITSDLAVTLSNAVAGSPPAGGGSDGDEGCGATGLEALFVLVFRRRAKDQRNPPGGD